MLLKKEVTGTSSPEETVAADDLSSYRLCLVRTLHACSIRFSSVAPSSVPMVKHCTCRWTCTILLIIMYMYVVACQNEEYLV